MIGGLRVNVRCDWCMAKNGGDVAVYMHACGHYLCSFCGGGGVCPLCKDKERVEALGMEYAA